MILMISSETSKLIGIIELNNKKNFIKLVRVLRNTDVSESLLLFVQIYKSFCVSAITFNESVLLYKRSCLNCNRDAEYHLKYHQKYHYFVERLLNVGLLVLDFAHVSHQLCVVTGVNDHADDPVGVCKHSST